MKMTSGLSERALRNAVVALAKQAKATYTSAVTPDELAKALDLKVKVGYLPDTKDGAYSEDDRTIIINAKITSVERQNFTCNHEIVHYLIRESRDLYSQLNELFPQDDDFERALELLCNIGAAELLLPEESIRELLDVQGFSIKHIQYLCEDRQASAPAAAIQLANCASHQCYIVVCEMGFPQSHNTADQTSFLRSLPSAQLYVLYGCWSPGIKYPLARYTVIPTSHLLHTAYTTQTYVSGEDNIPFKSGTKWRVPCDAMYYRNRAPN